MALKLSEFQLNRAVLELRYSPAFLLWDRAGATWHALRPKFPEMKLTKNPGPNQQQVSLTDRFVGEINFDRIAFQGFNLENDMTEFAATANIFTSKALATLEIQDLSRIGLRLYFEKVYADKDAMNAGAMAILPQPGGRNGRHFGIEKGSLSEPRFQLRLEGESTGCLVQIYVQNQHLEFETPREFPMADSDIKEGFSRTRHLVLLDVDYYAHSNTAVSKFNAGGVVEHWTRLIRRDVGTFVNGQ